ncbi:hypothetical protein Glove_495g38 [Diversispora epigaea]|uniref:Uncharacterized protein n=1 Tax=Diversispora epigaea TaxID=1348612 RepID=A0A397GJ96_9GLOM|nr:hypothetical protein Glove_495g38 [Diversispora epigaea]
MSKRRRFTSTLIGIGYIFPELHYGTFARNWWEPVSINLENTIVSAIPYRLYMCVKCNLNSKDFIITFTFITRFCNAQYLFLLRIEDDHCFLEIYQDSKMIQQFIGLTPDDVWKKVGILKNFSGSYIFGITHESIQQLLNSENNKIVTCLPDEWHNYEKLTKVFDRHIKTRKLHNTTINWTHLFDDWYKRYSTIVIFPLVLSKMYPENYKFQDKELRAWRAMFKACGCSNVTPFSQIKSQIEFWSRAYNNSADMQILNNLYKSNLLLINNKPEPIPPSISLITNYNTLFWESFRNTININKRGHNGKIRILSVIVLKFKYINLQKELGVTSYIINKARKHARLYGPGAPPLDKPKRKVQLFDTKTEYSGIAVMGFEDKNIIQQLLDKVEFFPMFLRIEKFLVVISGLGYSSKNEYYEMGAGFIFTFITRFCNAQYLFLLRIEDDHCFLEIYQDSKMIQQFIGLTPDDVWKKVTSYIINKARKHARLYGPGAPPLDKPKRKVQRINNIQEEQFKIFFQDRENDDLGGLCQICNDYGFTTFENLFNIIQSNSNNKTIMNTMFIQLDKLKRHLKCDFEEELAVGLDGKVIHDPCISHCLLFAFENISEDYQSKLTEAKEQLLYFLSHQARKFYLNAQFKAILSELDSNGAVIIADYKMRVLPQSARETKQDFFGKSWLFLEPGEAKTIIDSHHAAITHTIKRYLRIGYDISSGEDIVQAAKGLLGTSLANLEPNRNNEIKDVHESDKTNKPKNTRKKSKIKTIKGISNFFYWEWPCQDKYEGYIRARPLPHVGNWSNFSPSYIADLWNSPLYQPQPLISQCTIPETKWTIPITMESDSNENNININIEGTYSSKTIDIIDLTGNNNDIKSIDSEFPLIKGWALKSNQKFGGKGGNRMKKEIKTLLECFFLNGNRNQKDKMNAQDMQTELLKYVEAGELAEDDIPKVSTIQNWIITYA